MANSKAPARRRTSRGGGELGQAREKERMAWELWVNGATYQQIAETKHPATGEPLYASWETARQAVYRARKYRANEDEVEAVRAQRLAGLQAQRLDCMRQMQRVQPLIGANGRPVMREVTRADGVKELVPQEDQAVRMSIHRTLVQIDRQIARLTGTDAAQRFEIIPPTTPVERDAKVAELKERAAKISLLPRQAIEATARDVAPREGTG